LCASPYIKRQKKAVIRDVVNQMLLTDTTDRSLLRGGHLNSAALHEMLVHTKKRLAVHRYCEMAARLVTPGSFPFWLLYGVQLAAAGRSEEQVGVNKITDLKGPVYCRPVFKAEIEHGNHVAAEHIVWPHLTEFMTDFVEQVKADPDINNSSKVHYSLLGWPCEFTFASS